MLLQKLSLRAGRLIRRLPPARWYASTPNSTLAEALGPWATAASDIHDHLGTLFYETVSVRPRLIVELGTRSGISTRALLAAAEVTDAHLLSVDIEDCSQIDLPARLRARWTFVRADDVAFAGDDFGAFCAARGLTAAAGAILIDTSHAYEHTRAEITAWIARLGRPGVMLFHDTNMGRGWFRQLNGKAERGGNSSRGVIQAVEEHFGRRYDETTFFSDVVGDFAVSHAPWSSGMLVLRRF